MKRWIGIGVIVLGVALIGYALLSGDTDQEQIRARLAEIATAVRVDKGENQLVRAARVRRAFHDVLARHVVVRIADLPDPDQGRPALLAIALHTGQRYQTADVELSHTTIQLDKPKRNASAQTEATLSATDSSGLHREHRHVALRFTKGEHGWLITSVEVSAPADLPPEARP